MAKVKSLVMPIQIIDSLLESPLYEPIWPLLGKFRHLESVPNSKLLNEILSLSEITFVEQNAKSLDFCEGYEPRIYLKGEVQTRENSWHDFFNALMWHQFPLAKKVINQLQYHLQKCRHPHKQRLPAENMLTLLDENGVIVMARTAELLELIKEHCWHELFWKRREQMKRELSVTILGHGIYEKALHPYIGLTAQALLFVAQDPNSMDTIVAEYLSNRNTELCTRDLYPLPILGMPGWWHENEDEEFYSNSRYFRPLRR